jgi:hypothetical protein
MVELVRLPLPTHEIATLRSLKALLQPPNHKSHPQQGLSEKIGMQRTEMHKTIPTSKQNRLTQRPSINRTTTFFTSEVGLNHMRYRSRSRNKVHHTCTATPWILVHDILLWRKRRACQHNSFPRLNIGYLRTYAMGMGWPLEEKTIHVLDALAGLPWLFKSCVLNPWVYQCME